MTSPSASPLRTLIKVALRNSGHGATRNELLSIVVAVIANTSADALAPELDANLIAMCDDCEIVLADDGHYALWPMIGLPNLAHISFGAEAALRRLAHFHQIDLLTLLEDMILAMDKSTAALQANPDAYYDGKCTHSTHALAPSASAVH